MTIVGEAELDIRAVGEKFTADINRVAKPGLQSAGREADKTARGMSKSFGAMWSAFGAQSQGALGPVSMVVDQIQTAVASISKNSSLAAKGMVAGGIGAGVGIGLQALGSGELAAQQQLRMSIENLGLVYDDYNGRVEKTIKLGERHGHTAEDTMRVLNQLTIATKDPAKALADYNVVLDMAAVRHVPLQTAARMLSMVYAGNSRALKTFGIDLTAGTKALAAQKTATDAHVKAQEKLKTAQQNLADTEARIAASRQGHAATQDQIASATARVAAAEGAVTTARFKHGAQSPQVATAEARLAAAEDHLNKVRGDGHGVTALTVSQQIELRKAHDAVRQAEKDVATSAGDMATAHKDAAGAITSADGAIKLLAERVRGQADPSMNTFTGHLHADWATIEDDLARFGNKWGGTVTMISTGVLATSTVLEGGRALFGKFAKSGADAASTVSNDMAQMETSGRMSMGRLAGAVAGVALAIGTAEVGKATAGQGAKGAAETTLMGAVSGAAFGLSTGSPFGVAIGASVGALAGLATYFYDAGHQADTMTKKIEALGKELSTALTQDQGGVGAATNAAIDQFLTAHPYFLGQLAKNGVTRSALVDYARTGRESKGLQSLYRSGDKTSVDDLSALMAAYNDAQNQSLDMLAVTYGKGSQQYLNAVGRSRPNGYGVIAPAPAQPLSDAHTSSQLTSIHGTLLAIQHNTAKGTHATEDLHTTVRTSERARGAGSRSPELMTL